MKDYYLDGTLQMTAFSKYPDKDYFQGKVIRYDENGKIRHSAQYKDHKLNGQFISYDEDGKKYTAIFKDNYAIEGTSLENSKTYGKRKVTYKDGSVTNEIWYYSIPKNQIQAKFFYDSTSIDKGYKTPLIKYFYDKTGKQIGVLTYDGYNPKDGVLVDYYYQNHNQNIRRKSYYKRKKLEYAWDET